MDKFDIKGYKLLKTEELADVKGQGLYFCHEKSGARVAVIKNSDENKVFAVTFRTPPKDSTGVAHIIEHTVLCGSDKYPAKDPFIELAKGSLNTFLNALTYSDKTVYPVASCNNKDFANLMGVYMDAVFHPNIYKRQEIFKQEGWHYELESPEDELSINGIVYSEMKGVFSSPDSCFERASLRSLFPDTEYGVESGGDPKCIPDLTYEAYLDFHRKFYHPSNSYIYLYGDVDVRERLEWMDSEYLSKYDKITVDSDITVQKESKKINDITAYYSVEEEIPEDKGYYYAYNCFAGKKGSILEAIAFNILDKVLLNSPGAIVRQALNDAGIGEDVNGYYSGEFLQPYFLISAKNAKKGQRDEFMKVVTDALKKCVKDGIDERALRAAINSQEFRYREADFGALPKGIIYGLTCLGTWLYDDNKPFDMLHMNEGYKQIREKIGTGYFEKLIEDYFLNPKHATVLTFGPKVGMNAKDEEKQKEKLKKYKDSLSKEEVLKLVEDTKALKIYQSEPSPLEDLESVPLLDVNDIDKEPKEFRNQKILEDLGNIIWHDFDTNGITYFSLNFDVACLTKEELPYLGILHEFLGLVDTGAHTYKALNEEIGMNIGGMSTGTVGIGVGDSNDDYKPMFNITASALSDDINKAFGYAEEAVFTSKFTDFKRNKDILLETIAGIETSYSRNGTAVAFDRIASYQNYSAAYNDMVDGISYYEFLKKLVSEYDERKEELAAKLSEICKKVFTANNVYVSVTTDKNGVELFSKEIAKFIEKLPKTEFKRNLKLSPVKKNEGFKLSTGQVQYVARSGNYRHAGLDYNGALLVLKSILSYGYLWNEIRVKGGAYDATFSVFKDEGIISIGSYRDPKLRETNDIIESLVDYLEHFDYSEREMTQAIIGTIGMIDVPLTPRQKGSRSFGIYMLGRTYEEMKKARNEIFSCTAADIRNCAKYVKAILSDKLICTVGSAKAIDECKDLFDNVTTLV